MRLLPILQRLDNKLQRNLINQQQAIEEIHTEFDKFSGAEYHKQRQEIHKEAMQQIADRKAKALKLQVVKEQSLSLFNVAKGTKIVEQNSFNELTKIRNAEYQYDVSPKLQTTGLGINVTQGIFHGLFGIAKGLTFTAKVGVNVTAWACKSIYQSTKSDTFTAANYTDYTGVHYVEKQKETVDEPHQQGIILLHFNEYAMKWTRSKRTGTLTTQSKCYAINSEPKEHNDNDNTVETTNT